MRTNSRLARKYAVDELRHMKTSGHKQAALRWAAVTLLGGLLASALFAYLQHRNNEQHVQAVVAAEAEKTADAMEARIGLYQYGLRGARGAVLTAGEWGISRTAFRNYILTRDIDAEFPGARGFGFIRRVAETEETRFLQRARADGMPDFSIRQLTPHAGERYVIQYIEPVERNQAAIGLDIASEGNRRAAALTSMRSGKVTLSGPITLAQVRDMQRQAFLLLLPIYRSAVTPANTSDREASLLGWSYAALLMNEVLAGLHLDDSQTQLTLWDITAPGDRQQFYQSAEDGLPIAYTQQLERDIFGRHWLIAFSVHPAFVTNMHLLSPRTVLTVGVLISVLLAILSGALSTNRRQRRQVSAEQARLAAIVANSSDAIIGKTLEGMVTSWNHGAEQIFGYSAKEAVGQLLTDLVVPDELQSEEADILTRVAQGERISQFETRQRRRNGTFVDVSVTVSPIRGDDGAVVGASKTVRDISAQKAAKAHILDLNTNLEQQVAERTDELARANQLLTSVLRSASEVSIIATDSDGVIWVFNTASERMLGYRAEEMIGKSTPAPLHLAEEIIARGIELSAEYGTPVEGFRVFTHVAEQHGSETREWTYVRKDGSCFPVSLVVTVTRDASGKVIGYLGIAIDISERKTAEQALAASLSELVEARDQMQLATDVAELGVWSWSAVDQRMQWNDRMFEIYDLPLELREQGLSFEHWRLRLHPEDAEAIPAIVAADLAAGTVSDMQYRVILPNGQLRHLHASARVECDASGQVAGITGVNRDITAQLELEARLRYAKEQADAASAAKSSFLANMSHEIRTPMNAVLGMLQLVRKTELDARQRDYLDKANSAAKSLLGLLNDILDYSKIEAGKLDLDLHPFELEGLMRDLAVILSANQGNDDVEVIFDIAPTLPAALLGDSLRLQQILINLAGNALKFTKQGHVEVSVIELGRSDGSIQLRFAVTDTGIGISQEQQTRIFDAFTQAEASTTRRFGGTGLGLGISQRLAAMMGSKLQLVSEPGRGSRFWFDIVLEIAPYAPLKSTHPASARPYPLAGLRVLVVEDNALNRQVAAELLAGEGAQVQLAEGGLDGVARVLSAEQTFDVVIMDIQMPDIDGLEATRRIRADERFRTLPILAMTANASQSDREQCLAAGMNEHIGKPIDLDELVTALMSLWQPSADRVEPPTPAVPVDAAEDTEDMASILRRFGGKLNLFRTMLGQFESESTGQLDELTEKIRQQNWFAAAKILHAIKGTAGTMGARTLALRTADLERKFNAGDTPATTNAFGEQIVLELKQLLSASIAKLKAASGQINEPQPAANKAAPPLAPALWRARLSEILQLLESSNLRAIDLVEALASETPHDYRVQFGQLVTQVQLLDFVAAAVTARTFLTGE